MDKRIYTLFAFAIVIIVFLANAAGAGTSQGKDRTGSPLSEGTCASCHSGGSFNAGATIEVLDGNNAAVTKYEPETSYTIRISPASSSTASSGFGFQAVALDANNVPAGVLAAGSNHQILSINDIAYAEHSSLNSSGTVDIPWTSPAQNTGNVSIYTALLFCDGNGTTAGDEVATTTLTLEETAASNIQPLEADDMNLSITPNPVRDNILRYELDRSQHGNYKMTILDAAGKVVVQQEIELHTGKQAESLDISHLAKGNYILNIQGTKYFATKQFVKF